MPIPKYIRLELKDSDVESDITIILQGMEQLRLEALLNRSVNAVIEKDYYKLARKLATEIDNLRHDDKSLKEKLDALVSELNKERLLLQYDPLQDLFWKKKTPCFLKTLDMVLFRFLNTDINTLDKKHHIMQALKFIIESKSDKALPAPNILYGAVDISALAREIGFRDPLEKIGVKEDKITFVLTNPKEHELSRAFNEAPKLGYLYLRLVVKPEDYVNNKASYPGYPITTQSELQRSSIVLENKLQTIDIAANSSISSSLHELLQEMKQKGCGLMLNELIKGNKESGYKALLMLSSRSREFISALRKKERSNDFIILEENISGYKKLESVFMHGNVNYLLSLISEGSLEDINMESIVAADYKGSEKVRKLLSYPNIYCSRLLKFDDDRMVENYEAVK